MKNKNQLYIVLISIVLFLAACHTARNFSVEGEYGSISESEWAITVKLISNGIAQIDIEQWYAGDYTQRTIKKIKGVWSKEGNKVLLSYNETIDTLIYDDNLSLEELDLTHGAPGLMQIPPIDSKSIINGIKLWKKPHDFSINK